MGIALRMPGTSSGKMCRPMSSPKGRSPLRWPISLHLVSGLKGLSLWKARSSPRPTRVQVNRARGNLRPEPGRHQAKVGVPGVFRGSGRPGVPPLGLVQWHLAQRPAILTSSLGPITQDGGASSGSRAASLGSSLGMSSLGMSILGMSSDSRMANPGSSALGGSTTTGTTNPSEGAARLSSVGLITQWFETRSNP